MHVNLIYYLKLDKLFQQRHLDCILTSMIRGPDNLVPDNSVPDNSVLGKFGPGQFGTRTIRY